VSNSASLKTCVKTQLLDNGAQLPGVLDSRRPDNFLFDMHLHTNRFYQHLPLRSDDVLGDGDNQGGCVKFADLSGCTA